MSEGSRSEGNGICIQPHALSNRTGEYGEQEDKNSEPLIHRWPCSRPSHSQQQVWSTECGPLCVDSALSSHRENQETLAKVACPECQDLGYDSPHSYCLCATRQGCVTICAQSRGLKGSMKILGNGLVSKVGRSMGLHHDTLSLIRSQPRSPPREWFQGMKWSCQGNLLHR